MDPRAQTGLFIHLTLERQAQRRHTARVGRRAVPAGHYRVQTVAQRWMRRVRMLVRHRSLPQHTAG